MNKDTRPSRHGLSGHTLLEMLLSLVLLSIVMASVGSAVMFASQAVPDETRPVGSLLADSQVLSRIAEDLSVAQYVIEQSGRAVTIVVSDRTGDGVPDRLRYAWSGKAGDALTYQLNEGAEVHLLQAVEYFDLSYGTVTSDRTVMGRFSLEGETEIAKYDQTSGETNTPVTGADWIGQRVTPEVNPDHVSLKITEIKLWGREKDRDDWEDSSLPAVVVQARDYDETIGPGETLYAQGYLEKQLFQSSMKQVTIKDSQPIIAGRDLSLVVYRDPANTLTTKLATNLNVAGGLLTSNDGGTSWDISAISSMLHSIKVIPTKQDDGFDLQRTHLATIKIGLQSGAIGRSPISRILRLLQAPAVTKMFWDTDFDTDPTLADVDGDGAADWSCSGGTLPDDSVTGGLWYADRLLIAEPVVSFSQQMVTADIRMRSESGEGPLVYGPNRLDHEGDMKDPYALITQLRQDGEGGQELLFYNDVKPTTPIARINGLPQGLIDIRLILLPNEDLVSIHVNGQEAGTLELKKISDDFPAYTFALGAAGSDAVFGSARVRVGGTYVQMSGPAPVGGYALELIK